MRRRRFLIGLAVLVAVGTGLWAAAHRSSPYRNATVEMGRLRVVVAATGKVVADRDADIASKVTGRITAIRVREGDRVEAGEILVALDRTELAARRDEARAALREASQNRDRYRMLFERRSVSKAELDAVEAAYDRAKASLENAQARLDETILRAPFAGIVVRKVKEVGEVVNALGAPEPILRLADIDPLKVRAEVDESDTGKVVLGQGADVTMDAYPGKIFHGRVTKLASQIGRKSVRSDDPKEPVDVKVIETEITLEPTDALRLGMTVDVTIDASPSEEMILIPRDAVRYSDRRATVRVIEGDRVTVREVRTGPHDADHVAIRSGLARGERVVVP